MQAFRLTHLIVQSRVKPEIKSEADELLKSVGLTSSSQNMGAQKSKLFRDSAKP